MPFVFGLCLNPLLCASAARMDQPRFIIGSRGSPLALAQARMVAAALEAAHGWKAGSVAILPIKTSGDRIQDRPLAELGGKALWTKELDVALLAGESHCSVHSMKDVESERPETLTIGAMLPRADARDRLIGAVSIADLPEGARVGTSSPRRAAQLRRIRSDLQVVPIRGNVDTRIGRCASGEVAATFLAAAGLDRLGRQEVGAAIDMAVMLPAPAQAAIGIECRSNDLATLALLKAIDHAATHQAVAAERAFCRALGGTCHSPVAAHARVEGRGIIFDCEILSEDGREHLRERRRFAIGDLEGPAELAGDILSRAPQAIRRLFEAA